MTDSPSYILAVTGASGSCYALALAKAMLASQATVHLIVSEAGHRVCSEELGTARLESLIDAPKGRLITYPIKDIGARPASGSFMHDGMVIAPCSSGTLSAVANGICQQLLHRAAQVTLKERRKLILLHRETPLSLIDIRNMEQVTLAGGVIMPAAPGYYLKPDSLESLQQTMAARVMQLLGHPLQPVHQWQPVN